MERMKSKINGFEPYIQNTNIGGSYTGIDEFKKDYQPSINLVKDENISHLQFPIVHWIVEESRPLVADSMQTEANFFEPLVPEPSAFVIEMATENLNEKKLLGYWSNFSRIIHSGIRGRKLCFQMHKLANCNLTLYVPCIIYNTYINQQDAQNSCD